MPSPPPLVTIPTRGPAGGDWGEQAGDVEELTESVGPHDARLGEQRVDRRVRRRQQRARCEPAAARRAADRSCLHQRRWARDATSRRRARSGAVADDSGEQDHAVPSSRPRRQEVVARQVGLVADGARRQPRPSSFAALMTAMPSAPLCDMNATRPGGAWVAEARVRLTAGAVLITPRRWVPRVSCRVRGRCAGALPAHGAACAGLPEPGRYDDQRMDALGRAVTRHVEHGIGRTATTARSRSPGTSRTERCATRPSSAPPRGLTGCTSPVKPAASTLRKIAPPTDPARAEAPTTATARGGTRSTAAAAATASRSS